MSLLLLRRQRAIHLAEVCQGTATRSQALDANADYSRNRYGATQKVGLLPEYFLFQKMREKNKGEIKKSISHTYLLTTVPMLSLFPV